MDSELLPQSLNGDAPDGTNSSKRNSTCVADDSERNPQVQSRKRRKTGKQSSPGSSYAKMRTEVQKSAGKLRREGICPDTLFFPSLPDEMQKDENLRVAMGIAFEDMKTRQVKGKTMAWVKFANEVDCLDALLRLKVTNSSANVSIHRPRNDADSNEMSLFSKNLTIFQKRLEEVRDKGGVGNTLMFRNLPKEVECDELREILMGATHNAQCHERCVPLRIRTALSKKSHGRNFWVVYSSVGACQAAFAAIHLAPVNFRCGRSFKIHAFVHDDSTDADEKRRRERNFDLGTQKRATRDERDCAAPEKTDLELLEEWVREKQSSFVFMSP